MLLPAHAFALSLLCVLPLSLQNLMFITCPTADFSLKIETLGGVRLITH